MTTTQTKTATEALAEARRLRDEGIAQAEEADRDGWDCSVIDQAIKALNEQGQPWSANDLRALLPEVRQPLIGGRVRAAANRGDIRRVGYTPSTLESTHAHPIAVWVRATQETTA